MAESLGKFELQTQVFKSKHTAGTFLKVAGWLSAIGSLVATVFTLGIGLPFLIGSVFIIAAGEGVSLLADIERNTRAAAARMDYLIRFGAEESDIHDDGRKPLKPLFQFCEQCGNPLPCPTHSVVLTHSSHL